MTKKNKILYQNLKMVWTPIPLKIQVGSYLNGKKLSNSVEKFRGVSLCPLYSNKQLRKIYRLRKEKANIVNRKSMVFKRNNLKTRINWDD